MTEEKTEIVFNFGPSRDPVPAGKLINTSGLMTPNEKEVAIDGKFVKCGYFSHSSLNTYRQCQKKFENRYILKMPAKRSPAAVEGSCVHDAVGAMLLPQVRKDIIPISFGEIAENFADTIKKDLDDPAIEWGKKEKDKEMGRILDCNYRLLKLFNDEELHKFKAVDIERMIIAHVPIPSTGGTVPLIGFVDLIDGASGKEIIWDFKTGAKAKTDYDLKVDSQLTLYGMAEQIDHVGYISLIKGTRDRPGGTSPKTGKPLKGKKGTPSQVVRVSTCKTVKDYSRLVEDTACAVKSINAGYFDRTGRGSYLCSSIFCPYFHECLG